MRLRRLAVLVLTLASVTLPAAPLTGAHTAAPALAAGLTGRIEPPVEPPVEPTEPLEPLDLDPPGVEPGPGGPASCCIYG